MGNYPQEVADFSERVFSGADLLAIMDWAGTGVGSTMHIVAEIELEQARPARTLRKWTFEKDLTVERVLAMLITKR